MKLFILTLFISLNAFASEKICFGMDENKGNWMLVDISSEEVNVIRAGSKNVDKSIGYEVNFIGGDVYPFTKELNGTYRYDMGLFYGASGLMLVDSELVEGIKDAGNITLRSGGDNGLMYVRYFCRNQ